jgi:hypothetical protein
VVQLLGPTIKRGTPGRDRTCGLLVRSQALCPAELRAHVEAYGIEIPEGCPTIPWVTMMLQGWKGSTAAKVASYMTRSINAMYWLGHGGPCAGTMQRCRGSLRPRGLDLLVISARTESAYLFYTLRP